MTEPGPRNKSAAPQVFERQLVRARRARGQISDAAFLHDYVAHEMSDRLLAVERSFDRALALGARSGAFAATEAGKQIKDLFTSDLMTSPDHPVSFVADEEWLPVAEGALDLIVAPLTLHATNDLPGALVQIRRSLKPDGFFLGTLFGGETLKELRAAFSEAEIETTGGLSPRIAPFADVRDAGHLLQRAGFALPVADTDKVVVRYSSVFDLFRDLRNMGESNALTERRKVPLRRDTLARAAELYESKFTDKDGKLIATFELIYLGGWCPHESQQQPLRPGSAKARLADALQVKEQKLDEGDD